MSTAVNFSAGTFAAAKCARISVRLVRGVSPRGLKGWTVDEVYFLVRSLAQAAAAAPVPAATMRGAIDVVLAGLTHPD
jgi:hypothetical protein